MRPVVKIAAEQLPVGTRAVYLVVQRCIQWLQCACTPCVLSHSKKGSINILGQFMFSFITATVREGA